MAEHADLTVETDEAGRPAVRVDKGRAQALKDYLAEQGFSSSRHEGSDFDVLTLGNADPEEVQKLVDEWDG